MSQNNLFQEFDAVSSKQWKQQIQYELKGADYNETLVWESPEGIKVRPFYHRDEFESSLPTGGPKNAFKITQNIFVHDVAKSNARALDTLQRGAECIRFTLENKAISIGELMQGLPLGDTPYFFYLPFLEIDFVNQQIALLVSNRSWAVFLNLF